MLYCIYILLFIILSYSRTIWCREWLLRRETHKFSNTLTMLETELQIEDERSYTNFLRMIPEIFDKLLQMVGPHITKQNTNMRDAISA